MNGDIQIDLAGEEVTLLPQRAIWWPRLSTLIVADLHWGKDEAFRVANMPIPRGVLTSDLNRLTGLITRTACERLLVLGDMWHAPAGLTAEVQGELMQWRSSLTGLTISLVRGNHDRRSGWLEAELGVNPLAEGYSEQPFSFRHFPEVSDQGYVLAGHIHPAVTLRGGGRQKLRLPAFWFTANLGVLPAFGRFTGGGDVKPNAEDRVYVIAEDQVLAILS